MGDPASRAKELTESLVSALMELDGHDKVTALNEVRQRICEASPFAGQPCDLVRWVKADKVQANDYNPNKVAPPEMELLAVSIQADGYTQPIVTWPLNNGSGFEVIDGFHRRRVGTEVEPVRQKVMGYLPITVVNQSSMERGARLSSTVRHNRARGKHMVDAMSDIVQELVRRNWTPEKIAKNLGMEPDEVLRLRQITGLAEMFADREFSSAWEAL